VSKVLDEFEEGCCNNFCDKEAVIEHIKTLEQLLKTEQEISQRFCEENSKLYKKIDDLRNLISDLEEKLETYLSDIY